VKEKKNTKKKILAIVLMCIVLLAVQGGFWYFYMQNIKETIKIFPQYQENIDQNDSIIPQREPEDEADAAKNEGDKQKVQFGNEVARGEIITAENEKNEKNVLQQKAYQEETKNTEKDRAESMDDGIKDSVMGEKEVLRIWMQEESGLDPKNYTDWTMPMNVKMIYDYGFGYDILYKDVRFHDHICYEAIQTEGVTAPAKGTVLKIQGQEEDWAVIVKAEEAIYALWGLEQIVTEENQQIAQRDLIGYGANVKYKIFHAEDAPKN